MKSANVQTGPLAQVEWPPGKEVGKVRCLVTGGEGFIGSHIVDRLVKGGHKVRVLTRSGSPFREPLPEVDYVWASVCNQLAVASALRGIDVVLHLAWSRLPKTSNEDPSSDIADNVIGSVRLFEGCIRAGVRKVVFASSGGTVYGVPQGLPIRECHPTEPICSYGISKLAVEKYLSLFHHLYGLGWVSLRCSNPYGERQNPAKLQGAVTTFLHKAANGECIEIWGDGSVVRDYVYVGDVADVFVRAAESPLHSTILNVGSGFGLSLIEIVDVIGRVVGRPLEVRKSEARALDVPQNVLDVSKVREVLEWSPATHLADGIERTWSWITRLGRGGKESSNKRVEEGITPLLIRVRESS